MDYVIVYVPYDGRKIPTMRKADSPTLKWYRNDEIMQGEFERTDLCKGLKNGYEIGIFHGINKERYIIFTDHSACTEEEIMKDIVKEWGI